MERQIILLKFLLKSNICNGLLSDIIEANKNCKNLDFMGEIGIQKERGAPCQGGGRGFESRLALFFISAGSLILQGFPAVFVF